MQIAKIDMSVPDWELKVLESFRSTGFAVLTNHAVDVKVIQSAYFVWATFFASMEKFEYLREAGSQSGYFPFKSENAVGYSAKDLKEFYHVFEGAVLPPGTVSASASLSRNLQAVAKLVLSGLDRTLPAEFKPEVSLGEISVGGPTLLRTLHYPPLATKLDQVAAVRAAAHTDINLITILPSATATGLEVKGSDGTWIPVGCDWGDLILNVGDMLAEATGGYLKSTEHRVVNPVGENISRYSLPFFVHARPEVRLSARYTAGEYLQQRLKEIGVL